jgi:hypothetical protein
LYRRGCKRRFFKWLLRCFFKWLLRWLFKWLLRRLLEWVWTTIGTPCFGEAYRECSYVPDSRW